jgi:tRNA dimethylallyltransferase
MEIDWALGEGLLPIVTGGTGLYIRALLEGIADIAAVDAQVRIQVRNDMDAMGHAAFHERLMAVDPVLGAKLKVGDTQRLLRAYEVWLGTGKPLSWWQEKAVQPPYPANYFEIYQMDIDRKTLYERCDARFLAMMEQGAVDEVKLLLSMHLPADVPAMKSVGVVELAAYLAGEMTLEEAIAKAQQATRNYAKRQLTWFRNQLSKYETKTIDNPSDIANILTTFNK